MDQTFGKRYSLRGKKHIDRIFSEGIRVSSFPYLAIVHPSQFEDGIPFKVVFSAPKKKFKRAVQRNRIKRICREAIRTHKIPLEEFLLNGNKQLAVFLVYTATEEIPYDLLQKKTSQLVTKIIRKLHDQQA